MWLCWLLHDLEIKISAPTPVYVDTGGAIKIALTDVFHKRTKHVERLSFRSSSCQQGTVKFFFSPYVDFFIKSHPSPQFLQQVSKLSTRFAIKSLRGV